MALWVRGRERDADRHWLLMDRVNMQCVHTYPAWFHQSGIKHHVSPDISLPHGPQNHAPASLALQCEFVHL